MEIAKKYQGAAEQAIQARLIEIAQHFEVMQGTCGRLRYTSDGQIAGRNGGYKDAFPEMNHVKDSPGAIAKAIRSGKGVAFARIEREVRRAIADQLQDHLSKIALKAWGTRREMAAVGLSTTGSSDAARKAWETRRRNKLEAHHATDH